MTLMSPKQVAEYLQLNIMTVYRQLNNGKLPGFRVGGSWRVSKENLDQFLEDKTIAYK